MPPALLSDGSPMLMQHLTVGCSTGYMTELRGQWDELVDEAASTSSFAAELSAISESELQPLLAFLSSGVALPFHFTSVHAPSKGRTMSEAELVTLLEQLPGWVDAVVVHPDTMIDLVEYAPLGRMLVIENMDTRKASGRTADELAPLFGALPEAGLCFDIAHARAVDPAMNVGAEILERYGDRLRHVHISSLDHESHHVPLTPTDAAAFEPLLARCRDVPWILEAPPPQS
jgi:hypothetical protein